MVPSQYSSPSRSSGMDLHLNILNEFVNIYRGQASARNCQLGVLKFVNNSIRVICWNTNDILSVDLWPTRANVIFTITIEGESIYLYNAISSDDSVGVK